MAKAKTPPAPVLPERGCHNCVHWKEETSPGDEGRHGECRRNPPTALLDQEQGPICLWPATEFIDYCGEHRPPLQ